MPDNHPSTHSDPLLVLGVSADATPEEIRREYLALVKLYPPDRDPAKFAEIRAAFDQLSDPLEMLRQRLFNTEPTDTIEAIIADTQSKLRTRRVPTEILLKLAKTN